LVHVRLLFLSLVLVLTSALPARAESITIDSTNCSDPEACFGLTWTLTLETGEFKNNGTTYTYKVTLTVADDPAVDGTPTYTISAVDFKISNYVDSAILKTKPAGTWTTDINVLNSAGCTGPEAGFVCSQSANAASTTFSSGTSLTWVWYMNTTSSIFPDLEGAHIGAKLVPLGTPGRLLSEEFHGTVPEPHTLTMLLVGLGIALVARSRAVRTTA
jgi:hypothetical protein